MTYADKSVYNGQWLACKRYGNGQLTYADSSGFYRGQFVDDMQDGQGTEQVVVAGGLKNESHAAAKDVYTGQWKNGQRSGRGTCKYANGDVYEGNFVKGKRQGEGTITFASGEETTGEWENGALISSETDGVVKEN